MNWKLGDTLSTNRLYLEAAVEGKLLTQCVPEKWDCWMLYAKTQLGRGARVKALEVCEHALSVAPGVEEKATIRGHIKEARAGLVEELRAIGSEKDLQRRYALQKAFKEWDFDIFGKVLRACNGRWVDLITDPVPLRLGRFNIEDDPLAFREDEDPDTYVAEIKNPEKWTIPTPPSQDESRYTLKSIRLWPKKPDKRGQYDGEQFPERHTGITFEVDGKDTRELQLRTNPAFVVLPRCQGPAGHAVHARELESYRMKPWTPEELVNGNNFINAYLGDVIVINATGGGSETMARAICAYRALNAVIRKPGGASLLCMCRPGGKGLED